jgi:hypothetical protein
MEILTKEENEYNKDELKLLLPTDTRWLSNYMAIKRIIEIYAPLASALQTAAEEYPLASGLLLQITNFKIIGLLHAFADILYHLNNACSIFQKKKLSLRTYNSTVNCLKTSVSGFLEGTQGHFFRQFLANFSIPDRILYDEIKLHYDTNFEEDSIYIKASIDEACRCLLIHLDERFEKDERLEQLTFLDLKCMREIPHSELEDYGVKEIKDICIRLAKIYLTEDNQPLLDQASIAQEWSTFKFLVRGQWMFMDEEGVLKQLSSTSMLSNVRLLYEYTAVIPLSTVECERNFSKMNLIKTELRNQMDIETLGALMNISINGSDASQFPFHRAFKEWQEQKHRKYL